MSSMTKLLLFWKEKQVRLHRTSQSYASEFRLKLYHHSSVYKLLSDSRGWGDESKTMF